MNSENVTFDSDGCTLAGTYAQAAQPVAAALLIPGSGRTDRDSDVKLPLGMKLRGAITRAVADALGTVNVSSLRYDKRGVGASGGDYYPVGMATRLKHQRAAQVIVMFPEPGAPLDNCLAGEFG